MHLLLFGATGRTGQVLHRMAEAAGWNVYAPSHEDCNVEDSRAVAQAVLQSGAHAVVNCAAISGLEACADNPLRAHLVNAVAPATMALACRHTGARFVHLSTDYVLAGHKAGAKTESAKCKPISIYGESKREGELQVAEALPSALILRVSWICGNPARPSFVESIIHKARAAEPLSAIADKFSMPTDAEDIARVILSLLPTRESGIFHVCSTGEPVSWHTCAQWALQAAAEAGLLTGLPPLTPLHLKDATFFREPRPQHTAMEPSRLLTLGIRMPSAHQTITRAILKSAVSV